MIRFSTSELFNSALNGLLSQQNKISGYYRELSTGKKITSPSDAPVAAARVVNLNAALSNSEAWSTNAGAAQENLGYESTQLGSISTLIGRVRTLALQMASSTTNTQDRQNGAATVQSYLKQMISYANARDPNGNYLFAGSRIGTQPFTLNAAGTTVQYHGDSAQRSLAISSSDQVSISDPGNSIFMNVPNGNGTFQANPNPANSGTATISGGVSSASTAKHYLQALGDSYRISFSTGASGLTYTVQRGPGAVGSAGWSAGVTTVASGSYVAGGSISFNGMYVKLSGQPAAGDSFSVSASTNQSIFQTMKNLSAALTTASTSPAGTAQVMQQINDVLQSLDQVQTRVGSVQANVGSRIQSSQAAAKSAQAIQTQLESIRSGLQDASMPTVMSNLDQASTALQAASKAFVQINNSSLFSYL